MFSGRIPTPSHNYFEEKAWAAGRLVCGIDEAGRGALAGPVVAGAVILPPRTSYHLLKDSKLMTKNARNEAYAWITAHCRWAVGTQPATVIDEINILQATKRAMHLALHNLLAQEPTTNLTILVDAVVFAHQTQHDYFAFNFGESASASIAAGSIIAKVTRDRMMEELDPLYPVYGFAGHKGYGSAEHMKKIAEHGPSAEHRLSFCRNILKPVTAEQKSIFDL